LRQWDDLLWYAANLVVSVFAVVVGFHDGVVTAIGVWAFFTLILLFLRPQ
jgi:hypothetical protein